MSIRNVTIALVLGIAALPGCGSSGSVHLFAFEEDFLAEDVLDLMTIVFQAGENAFVGDPVDPADVVDPAGPGNGFAVVYDLPDDTRLNLGFGNGRVALQVTEDGLVNPDPLSFSVATTTALDVEILYDFSYLGETLGGRLTDVALVVSVHATRSDPADPFLVEYFIDGDVFLGETFCVITTRFRAPGRPRDGIEPLFGDADGFIDDPDIFDVYELDLDYFTNGFRAQGDVGCCAFFEEEFFYSEVF